MAGRDEGIEVDNGFDSARRTGEEEGTAQSPRSNMETWAQLQRRAWGKSFDDPAPEESLPGLGHTVEVTHR